MDYDGKLAVSGQIDEKVLTNLLRHKYFLKIPPKSMDRDSFKDKLEHIEGLSLADGAATITMFIARAIKNSIEKLLPEKPLKLIIGGGGAKNPTLMRFIKQQLEDVNVENCSQLGWRPDVLEAQSYAFLATRRLYCLPNTFPTTTNVAEPTITGEIFYCEKTIDKNN